MKFSPHPFAGDRMQSALAAPVRVEASRGFILLWLLPRLARFTDAEPGIEVTLQESGADGAAGTRADVAIACLAGPQAAGHTLLMSERFQPLCAPALRHSMPAGDQEALRRLPLLHDLATTRTANWRQYCASQAIQRDTRLGDCFDRTHVAVQAAERGEGLVLAPARLVAEGLRDGALLPVGAAYPAPFFHVLTGATALPRQAARFRDWLVSEAAVAAKLDPTPQPRG